MPSVDLSAVCPHCGGAPGKSHIDVQTRQSVSGSFFDFLAMRLRYRVTTVKVPGICANCARSLEVKRYVADMLTVLPILVLGGAGILMESKVMTGLFLFYLLYLARNLNYNWADVMVYAGPFSESMEPYAVDEAGTMRLPVDALHCVVRIGILPVLFVSLGLLSASGLIGRSVSRDADQPAAETPAPRTTVEMTREESHAAVRDMLLSPVVFAVPLDPATFAALPDATRDQSINNLKPGSVRPVLLMESRKMGGKMVKILTVWLPGTTPPSRTSCMDMTGRQLIEAFLAADGGMLVFERPDGRLAMGTYDARQTIKELSAVRAAPFRIYRTP